MKRVVRIQARNVVIVAHAVHGGLATPILVETGAPGECRTVGKRLRARLLQQDEPFVGKFLRIDIFAREEGDVGAIVRSVVGRERRNGPRRVGCQSRCAVGQRGRPWQAFRRASGLESPPNTEPDENNETQPDQA